MSCARDLEEDLLLALEHNFAVIEPPRGVHQAVGVNELRLGEAFVGFAGLVRLGDSRFSVVTGRHASELARGSSTAACIVNQASANSENRAAD
jgi:hypothetical protein